MSIKALFRTNVAIVETYSGWADGESATWVSPIAWTKGNLQPYKQGVMSSVDEGQAGVVVADQKKARLTALGYKAVLDKTRAGKLARAEPFLIALQGDWK